MFDKRIDDLRSTLQGRERAQEAGGQTPIHFSPGTPKDIDHLQFFLSDLFPNRRPSQPEDLEILLKDLQRLSITFEDIQRVYGAARDALHRLEDYIFKKLEIPHLKTTEPTRWNRASALHALLDLTHDDYWSERKPDRSAPHRELIDDWRKDIKVVWSKDVLVTL